MPTTITTYNVFVADTKARATEVNTNFSNYRGDLLPINTDTASASNNVHNIGSLDHVWNQAFITQIQLRPFTTGATLKIAGAAAETAGAMNFLINDSTATVIYPEGHFKSTPLGTPGATATFGQIARSSFIDIGSSGASFLGTFKVATISFQSRGNPVLFQMMFFTDETSPSLKSGAITMEQTTGANNAVLELSTANTITAITTTATQHRWQFIFSPSNVSSKFIDIGMYQAVLDLSAGSHTIFLYNASVSEIQEITGGYLTAREL